MPDNAALKVHRFPRAERALIYAITRQSNVHYSLLSRGRVTSEKSREQLFHVVD